MKTNWRNFVKKVFLCIVAGIVTVLIVILLLCGIVSVVNAESIDITFVDADDLEAQVDSIGAVCYVVKDSLLDYSRYPTFDEWRASLKDTTWYQTYEDCKFDTVWSVFPYETTVCRQIEWVIKMKDAKLNKYYAAYGSLDGGYEAYWAVDTTLGTARVKWKEVER